MLKVVDLLVVCLQSQKKSHLLNQERVEEDRKKARGNNPANSRHCFDIVVPFDMKACICHFVKWQIHRFISKGTLCQGIAKT